MAKKNDRWKRSFRLESLETRNLLTLIVSKPTIDAIDGPGVSHNQYGGITILQPTTIQIIGSAQPGAPGTTTQVDIYAQDSHGTIINGGAPLATVTPDFLGIYRTTISLPTRLRADLNYVVARQTSHATEVAALAINPTTISDLHGTVSLNPGQITGFTGTIANPGNVLSNLGGTIITPATPISGLGGTITTPVFPINTPLPGTAGPAVSTLLGGSGILDAQVATLSNGSGNLGATTSVLTQTGSATLSGLNGTFANGVGNIAATTGTSTRAVTEVAVSDPMPVLIHQPKTPSVAANRAKTTPVPRISPIAAAFSQVRMTKVARRAHPKAH